MNVICADGISQLLLSVKEYNLFKFIEETQRCATFVDVRTQTTTSKDYVPHFMRRFR